MTQLLAPARVDVELVDDFDEQALATPPRARQPNTRRATHPPIAFASFLRARYGTASTATFTLAAVTAWRDELAAQGLAASSVAQRVSAVPAARGRDRRSAMI